MSAGAVTATGENLYISSAEEQQQSATTKEADAVNKDEFLQLLVKQMTNQDPLNPTDNNEFMSQMAQMQSLEEQIETNELLTNVLSSNSVASAASMIGTQVRGDSESGRSFSGVVQSVRVKDQSAYLRLVNGGQIPLQNVMEVSPVRYQEQTGAPAGGEGTQ